MTKKLEQKLEEIKTKVSAFEEKLKDKQKGWLEYDTTYWFVKGPDVIESVSNYDDGIDEFNIQTRNIFRTKENAELWLKIHNRVHELIGDWSPYWGKEHIGNLYWCHEYSKPVFYFDSFQQSQGTTYMPKEVAEQLIEEFGNDLKIWICGEEL
jgi:hypothetical protein